MAINPATNMPALPYGYWEVDLYDDKYVHFSALRVRWRKDRKFWFKKTIAEGFLGREPSGELVAVWNNVHGVDVSKVNVTDDIVRYLANAVLDKYNEENADMLMRQKNMALVEGYVGTYPPKSLS